MSIKPFETDWVIHAGYVDLLYLEGIWIMLEQIFASHWSWVIAGVLIAGLEIIVPGIFLLWVGLGALATGLLLLLLPGLSLPWQLMIFAISMLSSLILGFYIQRQSKLGPTAGMMNRELEGMIGQRYVVMNDFKAGQGRIKVGDSSYAVHGSDELRNGDTVKVIAIEDGKLRVVADN